MKRMLCAFAVASALAVAPTRQQYSALQHGEIVRLQDDRAQTMVAILPSVGNIAVDMTVRGARVLRFPFASVEEFRKTPRLSGIPLLAPWANRLDHAGFFANGRHYPFNTELGNVRGPRPIHGLVTFASQWRVVEIEADASGAWVTSRLEFFREPSWMAQFPFAHTVDMTYRLRDGTLEVATSLENLSTERMPVSIGYHPYFQLTDSTREEWTIGVAARTEWLLSPDKLPTGEHRPITALFPDPARVPLRDFDLDHVFGDLKRDADGRATMTLAGRSQQLEVLVGPKYGAMVIYAPAPRPGQSPANQNFVCFEPMAAITNAMNLAHRGLYTNLQHIPPGAKWQESFWIRPSGF
jgi:aldose 1-epimerase